MSVPSRRWCLILVFCASVLMHLRGISSPVLDYHHHRQCNTASIARNFHEGGLRFLHPQIDWDGGRPGFAATEFPLYMWLIGLLWPVFFGELWGRLLAVLCSALTAVYLFKFLEAKLGREASFYAALLFSCVPLEIYFGRTVQPEAMALLATIAAFHHWDLSLGPGRPLRQWLAAVLWAFLAIALKIPYGYILAPLAALAWVRLGRESWRDARVLLAPVLALAGVFAWYRYASGGSYVVPTHAGEFRGLLEYGQLLKFVRFQFVSRFPELAATYGGLILMFFGAREIVLRRKMRFFAAWFLSICAYIVAGGRYTFAHEYTSLPFVPVNAAFMGAGLVILRERAAAVRPGLRRWARAGLAALVLAIPVHGVLRIRHWYRLSHEAFLEGARVAAAVGRPGDLFVTNDRTASAALFYLHRRGWGWDFREQGEERTWAMLEKARSEGARWLLTEKETGFSDPSAPFARKFHERFPVVYDGGALLVFDLAGKPA